VLDSSLSPVARRFFITASIFTALLLSAQTAIVRAQSTRSSSSRDPAMRKADEDREMQIRQLELMREAHPDDAPAARPAFEQISGDFRQLQLVNNGMMRAAFAKGAPSALDYENISKATAEINRIALRLKANLQLPAPEHDEADETKREIASAPQMKESLLSLDKLIMDFVNNPTFRQQAVLDAQHSARASHDLLVIIKLSQKIKQRAEKMKG
jgi:hypothetical protein